MESSTEAMTRIDHRKLRRFWSHRSKIRCAKERAEIAADALVSRSPRRRHMASSGLARCWYVKWLSEG
jgi:hypothetical protein